VGDAQNRLHLFRGVGQQDRAGHDAEIRQTIALVRAKLFRRSDQAALTDDGAQLLKNAGVHGCLSGNRAAVPE
jgi:hypothetical protein